MKHRSVSLQRAHAPLARLCRRIAAGALVLVPLAACDDGRATLIVLSDTTAATGSRVVVALPFDPAGLPPAAPVAIPDGPAGDSVRLALARRDSAQRIAMEFHRARSAANDLARTLAPLDRRAPDYARRHAAWSALADSAEALRARRDALTRRVETLRERLGGYAALLEVTPPTLARTAADSAAQASGRRLAEAQLTNGMATLELEAGTWWLASATANGPLRLPALERTVVSGARDTVEIE